MKKFFICFTLSIVALGDACSQKNVYDFLKIIAVLESSSGQNLKHSFVDRGIHAGFSAVGRFGLMPLTSYDVFKELTANNEFDFLKKYSFLEFYPLFKENNKLQTYIACMLASKLLKKYNNVAMSAFAWRHGHNLSVEKISKIYIFDKYTKEFCRLWKKQKKSEF